MTSVATIAETRLPVPPSFSDQVKHESHTPYIISPPNTPKVVFSRPVSVLEDSKSPRFIPLSHSYDDGGNDLARLQLQAQQSPQSYTSLEDRFPFLKDDRKRTRKLLSPGQTRILEAIWERTIYPSTSLREAVAHQLGIGPRKVQIWFQNKRQGRRRQVRSPEGNQYVAFDGGDEQKQNREASAHSQNHFGHSSRDRCLEMQAAADELRLAELRDEHGRPFAELDLDAAVLSEGMLIQHALSQPPPHSQQQQFGPTPLMTRHASQHGHVMQSSALPIKYEHVPSPMHACAAWGQGHGVAAGHTLDPRTCAPPKLSTISAPSSLMHRRMQSNGKHVELLCHLATSNTPSASVSSPSILQMQHDAKRMGIAVLDANGRQRILSPSYRTIRLITSPSSQSPRSAERADLRSFSASNTLAGSSPLSLSPERCSHAQPSPVAKQDCVGAQVRECEGQHNRPIITLPPLTSSRSASSPSRHTSAKFYSVPPVTPHRAPASSPACRESLPGIAELVRIR